MKKKICGSVLLIALALMMWGCEKKDFSAVLLPSCTPPVTVNEKNTDSRDKAQADEEIISNLGKSEVPEGDAGAEADTDNIAAEGNSGDTGAGEEGDSSDKEAQGTPIMYGEKYYHGRFILPDDVKTVTDKMQYLREKVVGNSVYYDNYDNTCESEWCFGRNKEHKLTEGYENFSISDYNAVYADKYVAEGDKVIYLTFDCGYPSENTPIILDILKAHRARANFFVTKMYMEGCKDYCIRMGDEGHLVCNHTVSHSNLLDKSVKKIASELFDTAEYYYEITGREMAPYFRCPEGTYSKRLLSIVKDSGYMTVFWSLAYGDYDQNNQPEYGYVLKHFKDNHHNGAIALIHNDAKCNVDELDSVLTMLEEEGYRFGLLTDLY